MAREKEKRDKEEQKDKEKAEKETISKAKKAGLDPMSTGFACCSGPLNGWIHVLRL